MTAGGMSIACNVAIAIIFRSWKSLNRKSYLHEKGNGGDQNAGESKLKTVRGSVGLENQAV